MTNTTVLTLSIVGLASLCAAAIEAAHPIVQPKGEASRRFLTEPGTAEARIQRLVAIGRCRDALTTAFMTGDMELVSHVQMNCR